MNQDFLSFEATFFYFQTPVFISSKGNNVDQILTSLDLEEKIRREPVRTLLPVLNFEINITR